jgi:hypothetical protein
VPATRHRRHPRRAPRYRSLRRPVGHRTLHDAQRSEPEDTSGTGPRRGQRQRRLKQGTCLTILLPLFHHPVSECSWSGGWTVSPLGSPFFVLVRLGNGARTRPSSRDRKPVLVMSSARSRCDQDVCRRRSRR